MKAVVRPWSEDPTTPSALRQGLLAARAKTPSPLALQRITEGVTRELHGAPSGGGMGVEGGGLGRLLARSPGALSRSILVKVGFVALGVGALFGLSVVTNWGKSPPEARAPNGAALESPSRVRDIGPTLGTADVAPRPISVPPKTASGSPPLPPDRPAARNQASTVTPTSTDAPSPALGRPSEGELQLLIKMRDALAIHPAEALRLADEHRRLFHFGTFAEERESLAIEALIKVGRTSEARARLARFKPRFPSSVYTDRLSQRITPGE